jgi:hypothetical protein
MKDSTFPTLYILEKFWGIRDMCALGFDEPGYKQLRERYDEEGSDAKYHYYIQLTDEHDKPLHDDHGKPLAYVWRRKAWETEYVRNIKMKRESEIRCAISDLQHEQIGIIVKALKKLLSEHLAKTFAEEIYRDKQLTTAQTFGIDISTIIWPDMVENVVKERLKNESESKS